MLRTECGKVKKFEDLIARQKARELTRAINEVTRQGAFARDFSLSGQIQRAAVFIVSNIAEGFERSGRGEFQQFLSTAKVSYPRCGCCSMWHEIGYTLFLSRPGTTRRCAGQNRLQECSEYWLGT